MTTSTVLARGGEELSYAEQIAGWYAYINNGEYTDEQQDKLADALMAAQVDAFNAMLPGDCFWHPHTSEITGPAAADLSSLGSVDDAMREACAQVTAQFDAIESKALGQ